MGCSTCSQAVSQNHVPTISTGEGGRCRKAEKEPIGRGYRGKGKQQNQGGDTGRQSWKGADGTDGRDKGKGGGGLPKWEDGRPTELATFLLPPPLTPAKEEKAAEQEVGPDTEYAAMPRRNYRSVFGEVTMYSSLPILPPRQSLFFPVTFQVQT